MDVTNEKIYYAKEFCAKTSRAGSYKVSVCECPRSEARFKVIIENSSLVSIYKIVNNYIIEDTKNELEELDLMVQINNEQFTFLTYTKNGDNTEITHQ